MFYKSFIVSILILLHELLAFLIICSIKFFLTNHSCLVKWKPVVILSYFSNLDNYLVSFLNNFWLFDQNLTLCLWNGKNPILSFEIKYFYFETSIKESWMNFIIRMCSDSLDRDVNFDKFSLFKERIFSKCFELKFLLFFFDDWFDVFIEDEHITIIFLEKLTNWWMNVEWLRIWCKFELRIIDNFF